ncbi:uncharacterized protein LOC103710862 [Phoenix dactylifera]|uniref:Uncharacterized protein LOC103710862 n=1 Tax=Phoenix dactylifera TaxID=42345 RepID=A0A8B7CA51_PHODC|nr:uncharacterized protein LOC103710862 [Phoenix dactylifera]
MEPGQAWCIFLLVFPSFLLTLAQSSNRSIESLNSAIRDYAFKELVRRRTGVLYEVSLPRNLSGITASVLRLRSGSMRSRGANLSSIHIPPGVTPVPPSVRRLVIVYHDLGNRSSSYYDLPGYSLVAPVVGCLAYDASNVSSGITKELELALPADRILVVFPEFNLPEGMNPAIKCAAFGRGGSVHLHDVVSKNTCSAASTGHFAIVVPSVAPASPPSVERKKTESRWEVRVMASACGVVGLVLVGLVGLGIFRLVRNKKMEGMESQAEEGEALGTTWVGRSKMPSATMMRTQPVIEDGSAP